MPGPTHQEKRRIIAQHPLLGKLTEVEIETLLRFSRVECYPTGEEIFAKDSAGKSLLLVLRGRVKIRSISTTGKEIAFNIIAPGEIVGEIAVLDGGPRTADAVAMTDCEVLVVSRREFMPMLEKHADMYLMLIKLLCERLRRTSEQVEDLLFRLVKERIAKALLQLSRRSGRPQVEGRPPELHVSQSELGTIVGSTRESVNHVLTDWEEKGIVELKKELVIIRDEAALERMI